MLTKRQLLIAYALTLPVSLLTTAAQGDSLLLRDFQYVKHSDPWLTGRNAAGLTRYQAPNTAEAELYLQHAKGGLADYCQSSDVLQAGGNVEAFFRINPRTVVYGRVAYDNFSGRHMMGSAFIDPAHKPFDITEDSLTNPGTKHRDTYQLTGAVGYDCARWLSLGLRLDYTAANYAKYKDLRHKNKLMDLVFTAGATVRPFSWLTVGADYLYHRTTESLQFSLYGVEDKVYKSLINYGPFIGKVEQFASYGFTGKSFEMPLVDDYNGVEAQCDVLLLPGLSLYNRFTYQRRQGYYGKKSPYTITYTNHDSHGYAYEGRLTLRCGASLHELSAALDIENLRNYLQSYREERDENDVTHYEYYDPVKTANRVWVDYAFAYTGYYGIRGNLPTWTLTASVATNKRKQTAYQYPYLRRQHLRRTQYSLEGERNIRLRKGILTVAAAVSFANGSDTPYEDDVMAEPSDKQEAPPDMEAFLQQEFYYLTATQYNVTGQLKYAFLFPGTRLKTHVRAALGHSRATSPAIEYCGRNRTTATVAIGCTF